MTEKIGKDIVAKTGGGKDFDPVPAGVHIGICYAIYSIGTQKKEWAGEVKYQQKVVVCWELPGERGVFKDKETGEDKDLPRSISLIYTLSLDEKANLRRDLVNWRGRDFTKAEEDSFSLKNILGKSCQLQIIHEVKEGDKTWANISAVMELPKGTVPAKAENPLRMWSIGDDPEGIPAWIIKKAKLADEWAGGYDTPPPEQSDDNQDSDDSFVPF